MFSPLSKILSIHYISTNPFQFNDKKQNNELINFVDSSLTIPVTIDDNVIPHNVFLNRMMKACEDKRETELIETSNNLTFRVNL